MSEAQEQHFYVTAPYFNNSDVKHKQRGAAEITGFMRFVHRQES
jgi:hypothetical protein